MDLLRNQFLAIREHDVIGADHVVIEVDGQELWFTQIHIAEIQALLQLDNDIKQDPSAISHAYDSNDDGDKNSLAVYSAYKGKQIKRKDGFLGIISDVTNDCLVVEIIKERNAGEKTKIQLSFITKNPGVYQIF